MGSSKKKTLGLLIISKAIDSLFFWPPESISVLVSTVSDKPNMERVSSTIMSFCLCVVEEGNLRLAAIIMASLVVKRGGNRSSWVMYLEDLWKDLLLRGFPLILRLPFTPAVLKFDNFSVINFPANSKSRSFNGTAYLYPDKMLSKVLFPAPEGPMMADNWPDRKHPLTPWSIVLPCPEEK